MAKQTADFTKSGVGKLPEGQPVVYKILTKSGKNNYTGVAEPGRVQQRLQEHLPGHKDYIPGAKVQVQQTSSIGEARQKETATIARDKPKYNKQGK